MTESEEDRIGAIYVAFAYSSPQAARVAWELARPAARYVSVWRASLDDPPVAQFCVVCGEEDQRKMIHRTASLLRRNADREIELPAEVVEAFRNRRRGLLRELKATGAAEARRVRRFGEQGAPGFLDGSVKLRPRQG